MNHPNRLLHRARLRLPSPSGSGRPMSRQELAEAVNAYLFTYTKRVYALDAHYVGRLERGARRWPNADYRAGLRAVLGAHSDAELGFSRAQRSGGNEPVRDDTPSDPLSYKAAPHPARRQPRHGRPARVANRGRRTAREEAGRGHQPE